MTMATSLRIDTAIKPASYLRVLFYMSLTSAMVILAWLASLNIWQYVVILIVAAAVTGYLILSRPVLLHMSQPPLSQRVDRGWQLMIRTSRGDELWQAQMVDIHNYRWAMIFEFDIVEPYQRSLSMTIFRDQVSAEQWRELNILANISTDKP
ncbi:MULTISPECIES: hypothetical protein [unclassified Psychrobacter]|uniref:hypothetical protein n=1 Tax=unclassified Psychrobacter TaxID=196806 RepID=UPI0025B45043|nr:MULTISPECIES: hypothetical protein [unclassified Psychrobacter]MDN3453954.1 hypothetical protein [Psychrobacter sp. APC 3350]MDN3502697.1 hypothetical protein [Psychrobacter sp. 5A.1]